MDLVIFMYILVLPISIVTAGTALLKYYSGDKELRETNNACTNILFITGIVSLIIVVISIVFLTLNYISYTRVVHCL